VRVLVVVVSVVMSIAFLAVVATSCEAGEGEGRLLFLCFTLVAAIVRVAAMSKPTGAVAIGTEAAPDSARRGPPDPRPQLAGSTCAHCEQKIMLETEAALCKTCEKPLHRECRRQHKTDAHRPISGQAYR
jgi:hypothetical protein